MWNLNGDDIKRAKEELKGRRAAIQARYESELKQLESDIADLETFDRFAVKFVADFKGEEGEAAPTAEPSAAEAIVTDIIGEPAAMAPEANVVAAEADTEAAAIPEPASGQKNSSRWRMRLNAGEASA